MATELYERFPGENVESCPAIADHPFFPDVGASTEDYARRFSGPTGEWFLEVQTAALMEMLAPWSQGSVLDVGGGHGQIAGPLVERGYQVTVLGSEPACAARITDLVETGKCSFVAHDPLHLPFEDRSFDVVTSFRLLAHVDNWRQLLEELTRVTRHAVVVDFPTARSLNILSPLLFEVKRRIEGNTRPFSLFSELELLAEFSELGFTPSCRRRQFFLPMALHRGLKQRGLSVALEAVFRGAGLTALLGSPVVLSVIRRA